MYIHILLRPNSHNYNSHRQLTPGHKLRRYTMISYQVATEVTIKRSTGPAVGCIKAGAAHQRVCVSGVEGCMTILTPSPGLHMPHKLALRVARGKQKDCRVSRSHMGI